MAGEGRIDLFEQFVSLSNQEQMLAFFDFEVDAPAGQAPLSGLCRISKPKSGEWRTAYVSLAFVVDTPDEAAKAAIDAALAGLESDELKAAVPGVQEVLTVPVINVGPENYVRQADVLLEPGVNVDKGLLAQRLIPAIQQITGLKAADVVWWDDSATPSPASAPPRRGASLLASIREYFTKSRT
jgi:hypothetical protein